MKINVTTKHIKAAKIGSDTHCPIALAVKEAVNGSCLKEVLRDRTVYVCDFGIEVGILSMDATEKIAKFVEDFDAAKPVKPFSFVLKFD